MEKKQRTSRSSSSSSDTVSARAEADAQKRLTLIDKEFREGLSFIMQYTKSVTIFGSSMLPADDPFCQKARELGAALAKIGYAVVTGGGPSIMEAANRGAFEAGGKSVGLNISLPHEQKPNDYLTDYHEFYYFFARKMALTFAAETYVFFPGGYGTLNEFFEIATLVQTKRIAPAPIVLFGSEYWKPFDEFMKQHLFRQHRMVEEESLKMYTITDDVNIVVDIVKKAPVIETVPFEQK